MNFYIDTNIFYEYYGRENLGDQINININHDRLYRMLHAENNKIFISSACVTEIITKFKESPEILKKMLKLIIDENIEIKNHAIVSYDFNDIFDLVIAEKIDSYKISKILESKIEAESSVGIVLCSFLLMVFLDFYLCREEARNKKYSSLPVDERKRLNAFIQKTVLNDRSNIIFTSDVKKVKKKIRKGYKINTSDCSALKESKKAYNEFIARNLIIMVVFAENMIKNYLGEQYSLEIESAISASYEANKILKESDHVAKSVATIIKKYRKEFNIDFIEENKNRYLSDWNIQPLQNKYQSEYVMELVTKWLQDGVIAEKNDVLDFLVLGGLDEEIFLTLDKELINFLKHKGHKSIEYIDRIMKKES